MSECVRANQFFSVRLLRAISMERCDASRHAGHNLCASCVSVGFPHRLHIPGHPSMSRGMTPFSLNRDCMYRRLRARQYTHCARPGGSVPPLASYADAEGVQQVCSSLAVPVVVFFLLRAFLFPSLHCLQPLFFETFRTLHPSRGRISAAASWTYPVRFVPLIFRHGLFHLLRRTLHFSGLVTGAPSARLHYGGARWPRLFFLFFAPGKELIAVIPVFK